MIRSVMIVVKHLIYGGTEKYTLNLANDLADKGLSVAVTTSGGPLTKYISSKVKVFIVPISRKHPVNKFSQESILKIAQAFGTQIIHTQCRTSLSCAQLARKRLNVPVVSNEHHIYEKKDYPFIIDELKFGADRIITTGPFAAKELIKHGLEKHKITTILNGVDTEKIFPVSDGEYKSARRLLNLSESDKVVVCISRIEPGKGIDKLARGFITVSKKIPEAKLILIGDDPQKLVKPLLEELIKVHNLQGRLLIFPGEYDIRKYHAVADIFCYPAIAKGMAVMEAMAAGLPVIGKKTIRKPLVIEDNISGLMTESTPQYAIDPGQIAAKLIYLLQRPGIAKMMGQAARQRIEKKFNLNIMVKKTLQAYQQTKEIHQIGHAENLRGIDKQDYNEYLHV